MNFPFNTKNRYLTNTQTKKLAEYFAQEPQPKVIYTNAKDEKRRVIFTQRPEGCIAPDTVFGPPKEDGSRDYHTPCATATEDKALIFYEDVGTGKQQTTNSTEWLKWAGGSVTMEAYIKANRNVELDMYVETLRNVAMQPPKKMTGEQYDEYKGAKWVSLKDGKPV